MTPVRTGRFRRPGQHDATAGPALEVIHLLASEIGPRRPCSDAEARAAHALVLWLWERDVDARREEFRGYGSFAHPYSVMLGTVLVGALLQRRGSRPGDLLTAAGLAALAAEGDLRFTPVSDLVSRRPSGNVVATIAPRGDVRGRVCLCGHMDSTRAGLMFHPAIIRALPVLLAVPAVSSALLAAGSLLRRFRTGRKLHTAAIGGVVFALVMLAERELRGEDVPGANDNASGSGVAAQLAAECAARPLEHTQVDLLITGCEEAGLLGAQAYLRADLGRARQTTFLNFDTVGGDVPLTYLLHEGGVLSRAASPRLVAMLERIAQRRPDLDLRPARRNAGLPTDVTAVIAHGCEGVTLLAQGRTIPNYHWPTDTYENVAPATVGRTLEVGREFLAEIDAAAAAELTTDPGAGLA